VTEERQDGAATTGSPLAGTAEVVATSCRILGVLGITHEALGHVSWRAPGGDTFLIKGKGRNQAGFRYTTAADVIEVDFEANVVNGPEGLQPPSETFIHLWLYRLNPDVRSVIHVHPEHAVLLTICGIDIRPIYGSYGGESRLAVKGVPVYPRSRTVTDHELGREFAEFMGDHQVGLMRGHGATVVGSSVQEATVRTIEFNRLATMTYKAHLLGTPQLIADDEIERLRRPLESNRPRGAAGGDASTLANWRYYERLTGSEQPES
jgi:ribulose-5-phosphate 4-epimerase/fuculose-1-phosphate aldolase